MSKLIATEDLRKVLQDTKPFINARASLPQFKAVRLTADHLHVWTDDVSISAVVDGVATNADVILDHKELLRLVKALPKGNVTLSSDTNGSVQIEAGDYKAALPTVVRSEDWPPSNHLKPQECVIEFDVPAADLLDSIERIRRSIATDDVRPVLTHSLWELGEERIQMTTTDGFRLSTLSMDAPISSGGLTALLPGQAMVKIARLFQKKDNVCVRVATDPDQDRASYVEFQSGTYRVTISCPTDMTFPNYHALIPSECDTEVRFLVEDMAQAVKFVQDANSKRIVRFQALDPEHLRIWATGDKNTVREKVIKIQHTRSNNDKFAADGDYVLDALAGLDSPATLKFQTHNQPFVVADDTVMTVVMPMFVQWERDA